MRLHRRRHSGTDVDETGPEASADADEASSTTSGVAVPLGSASTDAATSSAVASSGAIEPGSPPTSAVAPEAVEAPAASIPGSSVVRASIDVPAEIRRPQAREPATEPPPPSPVPEVPPGPQVAGPAEEVESPPDVTPPHEAEPAPEVPFKQTRERWWGRRTVTVPVDVPHRYLRRRAVSVTRSGRVKGWRGVSIAPILAAWAGLALALVGFVALLRSNLDGTWFEPTFQVLDADHTRLLAVLEIVAGIVLIVAGITGSRVLVAVLGLVLALLASAAVADPLEVQRELAIERWWAWVLLATGAVLNLAALQAPLKVARTETDGQQPEPRQ